MEQKWSFVWVNAINNSNKFVVCNEGEYENSRSNMGKSHQLDTGIVGIHGSNARHTKSY